MHIVLKTIKGHEYYYLVEKGRRDGRVVTTRTVYIGDRKKLAELVEHAAGASTPISFAPQQIGASLALATLAQELGIESVIDRCCPVRAGAAPVGRRLLVAAIHRALAPRGENSKRALRKFYEESALSELLPISASALDDRRIGEMLMQLGPEQLQAIESAVVQRVIEKEQVGLSMLAFDCTNFDSYASARTPSRLLKRGHSKSGRPLRLLGMGLLVTEDDGIPLLSFTYPGNENDVTAFSRFLKHLKRRRSSLPIPIDATVAADGGNISKKILARLEKERQHYVLRLPPKHLTGLAPVKSTDLPRMKAPLKGVRARKKTCSVYGKEREVIDIYSRRMHRRQLPGLRRDRDRARLLLKELDRQLERQRSGLRRAKPLTFRKVRKRVDEALSREHMESLFSVKIERGKEAPVIHVEESDSAWAHLQDYVLGRTLLVTDQGEWPPARVIGASRIQSKNEQAYRELKDPAGPSMAPLRHRRDKALRPHAFVVLLGLMLAKVLLRRLKRAGLRAPSIPSVLGPLKKAERARISYGPGAPPALRALAATVWVPSERTPRQTELLKALGLEDRLELGTTLGKALGRPSEGKPGRRRQQPGNSR